FDNVVSKAARVVTASPERLEVGGVSYEFCNEILLGLATIRARQLETELVPLAVWNGETGDGPGGASSVVQAWRSLGLEPRIVDLPAAGHPPPVRALLATASSSVGEHRESSTGL